ncbi:hypothetical protein V8D89_002824, partial [Ganoderma adspersum]
VVATGISDTPAWIVSKANLYARRTGKTPFVIYQGAWSILQRDFERDILPMCHSEGLALAPWGVLAAGRIRTDEEDSEERRWQTGENGRTILQPDWERTARERTLCGALEEVRTQVGATSIQPQAVAVAYVMQKAQLEANMEALDVALGEEQIGYLEGVLPFDPGSRTRWWCGDGREHCRLLASAAHFVKWPRQQAIRP